MSTGTVKEKKILISKLLKKLDTHRCNSVFNCFNVLLSEFGPPGVMGPVGEMGVGGPKTGAI